MMKAAIWSEDELDFLKSNESEDVNFFLNYFNGKTKWQIKSKRRSLGLKGYSKYWSEEEIDILKNNYREKISKLSELLPGRSEYSIRSMSNKLSLSRKGMSLKIIELPEMSDDFAYWLGLLASDGSVWKNSVAFDSTDKVLIDFWKKFVEENFNLSVMIRTRRQKKHHSLLYEVIINSNDLVSKLGDWSKDNWIYTFDKFKFNKEQLSYFMAGYFDGDGCCFEKRDNYYVYDYAAKPILSKNKLYDILSLLEINSSIIDGRVSILSKSKQLFEDKVVSKCKLSRKRGVIKCQE